MPRWNGFGRSLGFAALAAASLPVAVTFAGPVFGAAATVKLTVVTLAGLYLAGLAGGRSQRLALLAATPLAGGLVLALPLGLQGVAVLSACAVAALRNALLGELRPLRAGLVELVLGALGLAVAGFLASGGLLGLSLAIWGYFLVQSAYFLVGGRTPGRGRPAQDPFERARVRLERLLQDEPGLPR